ncbi:MAG: DUF1700 domain-containing protein [Lachnospiraceae bacterium]|nr:DUF1700 domain-containing protein [Lachnospiraceae bacterium]
MEKTVSKQRFFNELSFGLAFHYNDVEVANILNDYEEWFANETLQGKSEEEICLNLEPVNKIIKNLLLENKSNSSKIYIFIHNVTIQILLLNIMFFLSEIVLLKICIENPVNYLCFLVVINFIYFLLGMKTISKKYNTYMLKDKNVKIENIIILGSVIMVLAFQIFIMPKCKYIYIGKICAMLSVVALILLFLVNIYFSIYKMARDKQGTFITMLHTSGVVSLLFFMMNQLHLLYDVSEYISFILGSVGIYIETMILCFALSKKRICKE